MSIPFLTEDLARQRVVELRDEAGRLRTVRRARRINDARWVRRRS
jgi:hypothetical protein